MLECVIIPSPDSKKNLIVDEITKDSLFVVPDLESKFWLQSVLREHNNRFVGGEMVLRASELWQKLLINIDPEWQPLPSQMSQFLIERWMAEILKSSKLNLSQRDCGRAFQTIGQILPLLGHFQFEDVMDNWFSENDDAKDRWFDWYQMGSLLWQRFLSEKLIPQEWMKAVLINQPQLVLPTPRLVFDLGLEIDDVESELILNLSRDHDIKVLVPGEEPIREAYQALLSRCQPQVIEQSFTPADKKFRKLPSMLSEVKEAVGQVRTWLDQGVELDNIIITSPQIENYWATLKQHLDCEGVPCQKAVATPLSQLPVYQIWLSRMRLAFNDFKKGDGEQSVFESDEPQVTFSEFKQQFENAYDLSDFSRHQLVHQAIPQSTDPEKLGSLESFLKWSFDLMDKKYWPSLNELLSSMDDILFVDESLSFIQWMHFFENHLSTTERNIIAGHSKGIDVLPLNAVLNPPCSHVVLLGLSESNLLDAKDTALSWSDIESIKLNFGFNLPHADRHHKVDLLHWFDKKDLRQISYLHSEVDFSGQFQAPSLFWLQGAVAQDHDLQIETPLLTRFDQLMEFQGESLQCSTTDFRSKRLLMDQGVEPVPPVPYQGLSMSASSFEEYFKCPFRLFANKALNLSSLPSLDLDIDYMSRGRLMHRVCELIVKSNKFDLSQQQVANLVEKARSDIDAPLYSDSIWDFLKPYYVEVSLSFMQAEKKWRQDHPLMKTHSTEKFLKTSVSCSEEGITFSEPGDFKFRGVIDRIDCSPEGQVIIVDYKSSYSSIYSFKSWLEKGNLQLALYCMALMEGVLGDDLVDVVGAYYYSLKEMERSKGVNLDNTDPEFQAPGKIDKEQFEQFTQQASELFAMMLTEISQGVIEPKPHDEKICDQCDWNKICRYPNLNH